MLDWVNDLKLRSLPIYLDAKTPREFSFVSHAHSDHIAGHGQTLATPITLALSDHRLRAARGDGSGQEGIPRRSTPLPFGEVYQADADTVLRTTPAGHVLGSAMLHVTRPEGTLLYTGDYTLRTCLTAEPPVPMRAETLVMECTYGLPFFRFPARNVVVDQLLGLVESAFRANRQPVVMGYSLGKAQEITRVLTDAGYPVTLHGAPYHLAKIYEQHGMPLGKFRRYAYEDFHGPNAIDLRCRGVLVAPPYAARSPFLTRFKNPLSIVMTGWAMLKGANFRYGVDHALPYSDHADFGELLETVERVGAKKVYTHHGYTTEFTEHLRGMGVDASPAIPDRQMALFE